MSIVDIFVTLMDGGLVIMEGSLFSRFLLLQWMVALSLWKVFYYRYFISPQWMVALSLWKVSLVDIFVTPMDGRLFIMEASLL